jgi:SAM-dependent methyltransferase
MARQVAPDGSVLATDIDLRWAGGDLPNLRLTRHDIVRDPVKENAFDLVHARLVLGHLPQRDSVITRMVDSLRPGGSLVLEEFDGALPLCLDPLGDDEHTYLKVGEAFREVLRRRGGDNAYPRTLPHSLASAGLVDVGASGRLTIYRGGTPESRLQASNLDQVGAGMVDAGLITRAELDVARRLLDDPTFVGNHPLLITAWGRRPKP